MVPQSIQVITLDGLEARIYRVQQGYRVEVSTILMDYWHRGVFWDINQLEDGLMFELEKLQAGCCLGGDWMMLEGDFDDNGIYQGWFICKEQDWQGYDPLTNRCYIASTLKALKLKIDRIQDERKRVPSQLALSLSAT